MGPGGHGLLCDLTAAFSTAAPHRCEAERAGVRSHRTDLNCLFRLRARFPPHATSICCLQQFEAGPACALGQHPTQQARTGPLGTRVTPLSTNTPLPQREMFPEGFRSFRCKLRLNTSNWHLIAPREQRAFNSSEGDYLCSEHRPRRFFWQCSLKKLKWMHLLFHWKKCDSNWLYQIPFKNEIICEVRVLTLR